MSTWGLGAEPGVGGAQQKNVDWSPAGKKPCAFDSGGHIKGKWVSKGV